jgi:molybdenum cofactor guanylyltransferase
MKVTGIILAGGKSSRMGTNKALLEIGGVPTIIRISEELKKTVDELLIVTNSFEEFAFMQLPMVEDRWKGMGPLAGIEAGLRVSHTEKNLIVACDMPFISAKIGSVLLGYLDEYQAAVPDMNGRLQPLFAAYRKEVKGLAADSLMKNELRIQQFLDNLLMKTVKKEEWDIEGRSDELYFFNMNEPTEYKKAENILNNSGKL